VKNALYGIGKGVTVPKTFIAPLGDAILRDFADLTLLDRYDAYQTLLSYWNETMGDDLYVLAQEGFEAGRMTEDITKKTVRKDGKTVIKTVGWEGRLIPRAIIDRVYFAGEFAEIEAARATAAAPPAAL
jgi:type I restriction enzyme M protein